MPDRHEYAGFDRNKYQTGLKESNPRHIERAVVRDDRCTKSYRQGTIFCHLGNISCVLSVLSRNRLLLLIFSFFALWEPTRVQTGY